MRGRRSEPGRGRTSLKRSTRALGHRVTLTAAPENPKAPTEKGLACGEGPRDMTGNVQLYLAEAGRALTRMAAPLGAFGVWVKN